MNDFKVRKYRIAMRMTQEELAKSVGVTRQTIGLIEQGEYNPSINLCINLSKVLGKTLDELFWDGENDE